MRGQFFAAAMLVAVQGTQLKPEPVEPHPYLAALEAQLSGHGGFGGYPPVNPYALEITHKPAHKPSYHVPEPTYHVPKPTPLPYKAPEPVYKPAPVYKAPEPKHTNPYF